MLDCIHCPVIRLKNNPTVTEPDPSMVQWIKGIYALVNASLYHLYQLKSEINLKIGDVQIELVNELVLVAISA